MKTYTKEEIQQDILDFEKVKVELGEGIYTSLYTSHYTLPLGDDKVVDDVKERINLYAQEAYIGSCDIDLEALETPVIFGSLKNDPRSLTYIMDVKMSGDEILTSFDRVLEELDARNFTLATLLTPSDGSLTTITRPTH